MFFRADVSYFLGVTLKSFWGEIMCYGLLRWARGVHASVYGRIQLPLRNFERIVFWLFYEIEIKIVGRNACGVWANGNCGDNGFCFI